MCCSSCLHTTDQLVEMQKTMTIKWCKQTKDRVRLDTILGSWTCSLGWNLISNSFGFVAHCGQKTSVAASVCRSQYGKCDGATKCKKMISESGNRTRLFSVKARYPSRWTNSDDLIDEKKTIGYIYMLSTNKAVCSRRDCWLLPSWAYVLVIFP